MHKHFKKIPVLIAVAGLTSTGFAQVEPVKPAPDTVLELHRQETDNIPVISIDENENQDGSVQNVSSILTAGRDPFLNAATFKFSAVRFRIRGYDADNFTTYMNGIPMDNLDNGFTPFGLWGGLNDVTRNRDYAHGLSATPYAFGDLGGLTFLDTRASYQRKQTSLNYAISNRNYMHRIMVSHSTGLNKKGWAYSFAASRRWAEEGYVEGTFYDGWSFYTGVDKRISDKHLLSLVAFATPTKNGRQGPTYEESRQLAGTNFYNPFWGYQNGKKRNANVAKSFQPMGILTHDWKITDRSSLLTAAAVTIGKRSTTALDWYNVADPRPDYYRYLPSYQLDPVLAAQTADAIRNNVNLRQINWDALYMTNYNSFSTIQNANGIEGNDVSGRRSRYIVEERVINTKKYNFSSTLNTSIGSNVNLSAGVTFQSQNNHYYKEVDDLLGGDFYVDLNQFAERDFATVPGANQNDLNNPNRILKTGDKFGYNYNIKINRGAAWLQGVVKFRRIDLFFATEHAYTGFYRVGNTRVGLFPNNSYGKSSVNTFYTSSIKGGATYKINGRNYVFVNGGYMSRPPYFENAYISARTRDFVQENMRPEEVATVEGGYVMNAPRVKIRANGFYTQFKHQLDVISAYSDYYRTFVNYALSNIGKVHMGVEFGAEVKVYKGLSVNAAASVGDYHYNTRQLLNVTIDNQQAQVGDRNQVVYSKNFNVPTAQKAYTIGVDYRSPKFWFINVSANYFDDMYLNYDPIRRTEQGTSGVDPNSKAWTSLIDQTKVSSQFTLDAFAGWSFRVNNKIKTLKKPTFMVINIGVNNLLDNKDIVSAGFEQLRFNVSDIVEGRNRFPDKRFYSYGLNYFASIGFRF